MDSVSREMEILRKNQKKWEISKTLTEMKNAFDGLLDRLNIAEEGTSELKDIVIELSKIKSKGIKRVNKNRTKYWTSVAQPQRM